jgi:hypothetical protein
MKQLLLTLMFFSLMFTACTKSDITTASNDAAKNIQEDNGCIERIVIPVTAHTINSPDVSTVNSLFSSNGIDNSKFRYYRYIHDTLQTLNPPYTKYDQKIVMVDQYTNNVRIFTGDLGYNFLNNSLNFRSGYFTNGTSLDTVPKLTLGQIRKMFLDNIEQFDHAPGDFKNSCFKAEFGYYNLNAGISYAQEVLIKAWRVTLKNSVFPSEYPMAFYQDANGKLIYYDNGTRTFQ